MQPLQAILKPRSITVVGASRKPATIGHQIVHNLQEYGFTGAVYPVNPNADAVCSIACSPSVSSLGVTPDLAVIAVPRELVLGVVKECAMKGIPGVVVISAGFKEIGGNGERLEQELVSLVRSSGMRMVGPNCMGVLNTDPAIRMNATFAHLMPPPGRFAFLSQSGALGLSVLDYAQEYGIGISQFVSVGNKPDISGNDLLLHWENDPTVDVIMMYVENFGNPARFLEIASRVTQTKPIIALKAGRSTIGARAAASHTGALAASDRAVDALLRQAGVLRAHSTEELFDIAMAFTAKSLPRSRRTAVVTNAGGPGILAADALEAHDIELPVLAPETIDMLSDVLPAEASLRNPLDMIASANPKSYRIALQSLLADPGIDAAMAIFVPPMGVSQQDVADAVVSAAALHPDKPVTAVLMGRNGLPEGKAQLHDAGIPAYIFPESAARGLSALNAYAEWKARPRAERMIAGDAPAAALAIIANAVAENRCQLLPEEALGVVSAYGVNVVTGFPAGTADEAVMAATTCGYPVVLKLSSPDITHKTDVGGVRVGVRSEAEVRHTFAEIVGNARRANAAARIDGVIVQRMYNGGIETIAGASRDPSFGPVIMFGLGGTNVEALDDVSFGVAPLSPIDACDMMNAVRARRLLDGTRGRAPADRQSIMDAVLAITRIVMEIPAVMEIEINPLVADETGAVALDARIRLSADVNTVADAGRTTDTIMNLDAGADHVGIGDLILG